MLERGKAGGSGLIAIRHTSCRMPRRLGDRSGRRDVLFHLSHPLRSDLWGRPFHQIGWSASAQSRLPGRTVRSGGFGRCSGLRAVFHCAGEAMHEAELASVAVARCQGPNSGEAGSGHRNFRGLKVAHNFDRRTSRRPMFRIYLRERY